MKGEYLSIEAESEIAYESPDHLIPEGTRQDSSRSKRYQMKLFHLMRNSNFDSIMDLGCAGGGYISDFHDLGFIAVGIEGSDFSKKRRRAEWSRLSDICLFTADITKNFQVNLFGNKHNFDVISAFEVFEHIKYDDILKIFTNINNHSNEKTVLIFTISTDDCIINGVNLHQTVKPKEWWVNLFDDLGWTLNLDLMNYFNEQYLRGPQMGLENSFGIILTKNNSSFKYNYPKPNIYSKIIDIYNNSKLHKILSVIYDGVGRS